MSMQTAYHPVAAIRATIWSRFADWAWRALERLPSCFKDVDPALLRRMPPL